MHRKKPTKRVVPQPRDLSLIRMLAEDFRILAREQIGELFPMGSVARQSFRLQRLRRAGYLSTRPITGFGAATKLGYYLGPKAVELFDPVEQNAVAAIRAQAAELAPSDLVHRMLIDSVHIRFLTATRDYPNYKLVTWVDQYSPWWESVREYGVPIQADAYAEYLILMYFDSLFTFFLEVDRATERGQAIKDKIERYVTFAAAGNYQSQFAVARPFRVLFVTTSQGRLEGLSKLMEERNPDLFWLTTVERFKSAKLFDPHWVRPGRAGLHALSSHDS
jgi:hypothetical protein